MNLKRGMLMLTVFISMILVQGCSNGEVSDTARIQLNLVDEAGVYLEVKVDIVDVQYNNSEDDQGWISFESFEGQIVDLTKLIGGVNLVLSDEIIPAGTLKQIRLVLGDENTVLVDGEQSHFPLDTPSAQQSGLKLNIYNELEGGFSYTFILDWNVQKSIVKTGSDKYILKPVIRVEAAANSGSIDGNVIGEKTDDDVEGAVALKGVLVNLFNALEEGSEAYATTTTDAEGYFLFDGLPPANYKIEFVGYDTSEPIEITVIVGEIQNAGTIELVATE